MALGQKAFAGPPFVWPDQRTMITGKMETLPTILLKPGEADRIIAGHPWVYQSSVMRLTHPAADGAVVQVKDHRQRLLGVGCYNSKSKILVRMLAPERVNIDLAFFVERIRSSLELRKKWLPEASSFRVVNAESDFLNGVIVDKYEDVLVLQTAARGMDDRKSMIVEALQQLLHPRAIVERNDATFRKFEGMTESSSVLMGELSGTVPVHFHDLTLECDPQAGHKTGLYLDQQVNYRLVAELLAAFRGEPSFRLFLLSGCFRVARGTLRSDPGARD